jgi:hypothetical protein
MSHVRESDPSKTSVTCLCKMHKIQHAAVPERIIQCSFCSFRVIALFPLRAHYCSINQPASKKIEWIGLKFKRINQAKAIQKKDKNEAMLSKLFYIPILTL